MCLFECVNILMVKQQNSWAPPNQDLLPTPMSWAVLLHHLFLKISLYYPYGLKISKGENFWGFLSDLENFNLKHFGSSKMPLKTYFQSQVTAPWVINILSAHCLWLAKPWNFYHKNFFLKEKSLNLDNFRLYSRVQWLLSRTAKFICQIYWWEIISYLKGSA